MQPSDYNRTMPGSRQNAPDPKSPNDGSLKGDPMSPAQLGSPANPFAGLFAKKEEYTTFTNEPARNSLTDPPPGYRTPSPTQPYGVGKERWTPAQVPDRNVPIR
jgi:hypothetical protein